MKQRKKIATTPVLHVVPSEIPNGIGDWRKAKNRSDKSKQIYDALCQAAAEVIGEVGFADASIAMITQRADVAQGTFYNYFDSRQELFDKLVPEYGQKMLAHIRKMAKGGHNFEELEERAFRGLFSFLHKFPYFSRMLNEAENFAPAGHKQHFQNLLNTYLKFLKRSLDEGKFPAYREDELEVIAYILIAARSYLALPYTDARKVNGTVSDQIVKTFMKFVLYGLMGAPHSTEDAQLTKTVKVTKTSKTQADTRALKKTTRKSGVIVVKRKSR